MADFQEYQDTIRELPVVNDKALSELHSGPEIRSALKTRQRFNEIAELLKIRSPEGSMRTQLYALASEISNAVKPFKNMDSPFSLDRHQFQKLTEVYAAVKAFETLLGELSNRPVKAVGELQVGDFGFSLLNDSGYRLRRPQGYSVIDLMNGINDLCASDSNRESPAIAEGTIRKLAKKQRNVVVPEIKSGRPRTITRIQLVPHEAFGKSYEEQGRLFSQTNRQIMSEEAAIIAGALFYLQTGEDPFSGALVRVKETRNQSVQHRPEGSLCLQFKPGAGVQRVSAPVDGDPQISAVACGTQGHWLSSL